MKEMSRILFDLENQIKRMPPQKTDKSLERNDFVCPGLRFQDICHPTDDAHLYLVCQLEIVEAGGADDQAHTQAVRFETDVPGAGIHHNQPDPIGVETNGMGQRTVLNQKAQLGIQELMLQGTIGTAHAIPGDQNDRISEGIFHYLFILPVS